MQNAQQDWSLLLTPREWEFARLMARGLSNKEIAQRLGTSPGTVKFQAHCVLQKLGVAARRDLILQPGR
jgi:DNA-binding NarL/FixJ family response regulator